LLIVAAAAAAVVAFAVALNCLKGVFLGFGVLFLFVCFFSFLLGFWRRDWRELGGS
jgi:hypothetical protein